MTIIMGTMHSIPEAINPTVQADSVNVQTDSLTFVDSINVQTDSLTFTDSVSVKYKPDEKQTTKLIDSLQIMLQKMAEENKRLKEQIKQKDLKISQANSETDVKSTKQAAKIYEKMAPEEAAQILSGLNTDIVVAIISAMNDRQAAKILASMDPNIAMEISKKLVKFN